MATSEPNTEQALELKALELLQEARQRYERSVESHAQSLREEIQFKRELIILLETHRHEMAMIMKVKQD